MSWGRGWHALTALTALVAVVLQLVLVVQGSAVLVDRDPPGLGMRLYRFVAYFTVQSNLLVLLTTAALALHHDGPGRRVPMPGRVLRLAGVAGIAVTGVVHFVALRPLLDLDGADAVADTLLHLVVPMLAVVGWVALGPRGLVSRRVVALSLLWPVLWLAWTLVAARVTGWYPYPFLDPATDGTGAVVVACVAVTVVFLAVLALLAWADRRLGARLTPASG